MTHSATIPCDDEIQDLKEEISQAKRLQEYQRLKQDLANLAQNSLSEERGSLQTPDTHRVLKTTRHARTLIDSILNRLLSMFSIQPVIGSIIALILSAVTFFYIFNEMHSAWFLKYQTYFSIGLQIAIAITIIKSSTRSLLLPFIALFVGGVISNTMGHHTMILHFERSFYDRLMIVGIIGMIVSIMSID